MTRARDILVLGLLSAAAPVAAGAQAASTRGAAEVPAPAAAPQAPADISGTIVNEAGQPLRTASVAVRSARDSTLVNGAVARDDGSFRVGGLPPGRYNVRVRALGYAPAVRTGVVVGPQSPRVELGRIQLTPVATQLEGVKVVGQRADAVLAPDRNSYTVKDMPAASSGNAVEVLRHVPGVEVDADNKVSLRGNENVVVQINGRPSPMRGEALGNFLAQLPANMVERVEVVPNPSARDDPDGMAGIVNLVLKQRTDLGASGGLTLAGGSTGQVNASGNAGYQRGDLTLFGSYGFMRDHRELMGFNNRENLVADPATFLYADTRGNVFPRSHSVTANAEYKLRERSVLSSNLVLNNRRFERDINNYYRQLDENRETTGRYDRLSNTGSRDLAIDYSLSFKRTIKPQRNEFSSELRLNRSSTDFDGRYVDQVRLADGTAVGDPPAREADALDEVRHEVTLQTDVTRPLGERAKFEAGYKGTLRGLENDFAVSQFSYDQGAYVRDAARSSAFDYDDQIHALYGVVSRNVGKLDLQGGVRLEQASTRFDLTTTRESFDNDYRTIYPSGIVAYNLDDKRQIKASYSKRVTRPDTRQMNPFGFREDALNVFRGNPYLKPEYTHAMELGYQHTFSQGSLQLSPFYRHTLDAVRFVRVVDDVGMTTTTFRNVATSDSYGADANFSLRLKRLSGFGGVNVYRQVSDASGLSGDASIKTLGWSARANATWKMNPTLDLQGFLMYRGPLTSEYGRLASMTMTNVSLRQKLRGEKASVTLRVVDPFNSMRFGFRGSDERMSQESIRYFGMRGAFVSFNYNFGQQPRLRPRTPEQQPDSPAQPGIGPS